MNMLHAVFHIVAEKNCPLYRQGERLLLSEKTLACPEGKEVCLILVRDMTQLLFRFLQKQPQSLEEYSHEVYNCSGCRGLIKFALLPAEERGAAGAGEGPAATLASRARSQVDPMLKDNPLLRLLSATECEALLGETQEIAVDSGAVLIRKGEKNLNLYILLSGQLRVEDVGVHLATLRPGEICGEMSYLGADLAVSTVVVTERARVLAVPGDVFGKLLGHNPAVQTFMAQLLALRLRQTNEAKAQAFASCMSGRIDEIAPAELFQIFHMHQKTGVLTLDFSGRSGKVSFRQGCIINAEFGELRNEEAIFKVLAERRGLYRFTTGLSPQEMRAAEIGDFMALLMEGVKRVDEEQSRGA